VDRFVISKINDAVVELSLFVGAKLDDFAFFGAVIDVVFVRAAEGFDLDNAGPKVKCLDKRKKFSKVSTLVHLL
jgi:hypothetical protein